MFVCVCVSKLFRRVTGTLGIPLPAPDCYESPECRHPNLVCVSVKFDTPARGTRIIPTSYGIILYVAYTLVVDRRNTSKAGNNPTCRLLRYVISASCVIYIIRSKDHAAWWTATSFVILHPVGTWNVVFLMDFLGNS